jgi:hypothetical protein
MDIRSDPERHSGETYEARLPYHPDPAKKEINGLMIGLFHLPLEVIRCIVVVDFPSSTLFPNILQPQKFD